MKRKKYKKNKISRDCFIAKKKNQDKCVLELTLDQLTDYSSHKLICSEAKYCISCTE